MWISRGFPAFPEKKDSLGLNCLFQQHVYPNTCFSSGQAEVPRDTLPLAGSTSYASSPPAADRTVCPLGTTIKTTLRPLFWELQNNSSPAPCRVLISTIMSFNEVSSPLDPSSWLLSDCSVLWDFSEHTRDLHDALLLLEWFCNARGLSIPATSKHVFRVPVAREAEHGGLPAVCTASRQGCSVSRSLAAGCMSPLAENRQWPKNDMVSSGAMYYFAVCISFPPLI